MRAFAGMKAIEICYRTELMMSDVASEKDTLEAADILGCETLFRVEAEQEIVEANKRLIEIYEGKINQVISRVWEGEEMGTNFGRG